MHSVEFSSVIIFVFKYHLICTKQYPMIVMKVVVQYSYNLNSGMLK